MELKNKKVSFIGDSITEGVGVCNIENRYDNRIKQECNLSAVCNYGISGTRIAYQEKPSGNASRDLYFCGRAYKIAADSDVIVVFGGTNDYGHGDAPFGEMSDRRPDTFCGAVDFLMNFLKANYPNARSVFLTPARRVGDELPSSDIEKRTDAKPLLAYVDVILTKGREYNIPVLNLYTELGINPNNESEREKYAPDGIHFNDEGHKLIAELLTRWLKNL